MEFLKHTVFLLFLFISFSVNAQEDTIASDKSDDVFPSQKKQYFVFSPRVSITVPHPIANKAFRKSFVGVYEVSAGLNMMIFKGAFVGVTYKNGLFKITENKIPDLEANMAFNNAGIKIGTDFFVGDKNRIIGSAALTVGNNWTTFPSFRCKIDGGEPSIKGFSTTYIEPEVNLFFLIEQNFGIGATLSYSFFNRNFDPYELCLNEWSQFDKENAGNIQYLSFGFGFYYSFLKKKG